MKSLQELLARLKELNGELATLMDNKDVPDAEKAGHLAAIEAKIKEIEATEKEIEIVKAAEAARARAAQPANQPTTIAAEPAKTLTGAEKVGLIARGMVAALTEHGTRGIRPVLAQLDANGFGSFARELEGANFVGGKQRTMNSATATAGGVLLPEDMAPDIIDLLRPNTTFLQGNPRVVPMPNGTYKLAAAASGATASYRGETKPANVSQPTMKAINMSAKLLAGIVPLSNQLIRWSLPDIQAWATMDLSAAMGTKMDYMAFFGDGTEDTPLGILNIPGVKHYTGTYNDATKPTYTEVDAAARKLLTPIESYAQLVMNVEWRMAPRTFGYLSDLRDGNGNLIYPTLQGNAPTFKGYPVRKTTQFPINLGGTTDESYIALIAFGHVLFGDALRMQLAISDVASVVNGSNTINAFQDGVTVIRAEAEHDFDARYSEAIQVLDGVRWGA